MTASSELVRPVPARPDGLVSPENSELTAPLGLARLGDVLALERLEVGVVMVGVRGGGGGGVMEGVRGGSGGGGEASTGVRGGRGGEALTGVRGGRGGEMSATGARGGRGGEVAERESGICDGGEGRTTWPVFRVRSPRSGSTWAPPGGGVIDGPGKT